MGYIGQPLNAGNLAADVFSGDGSTTGFTLSYSVGSANSISIYIDGVKQAVSTYTASGTTLTFTTAPPSGTNNIEVIFLALEITLPTPGDATVTEAKVSGPFTFQGGIGGLTCSNNGTDADHDLDIATGYARDYGDAVTMVLSTAITKQIDATWSVGDNAGGLDTGAVAASTGYGVYLIRRSDTGVVDALFSTDMSAAGSSVTMPTNYDQKRLIGWVRTDGSSNILSFIQSGDYFRLQGDVVQEVSDATMTANTYETLTMTAPPLSLAHCYLAFSNTAETATSMHTWLRTKGSADSAVDGGEASLRVTTSATADESTIWKDVFTDSSSQVEYAVSEVAGTTTCVVKLYGCTMITRSNPQ